MMTAPTRWIILSPHLDDAVISCGGLISALRSEVAVEVWTMLTSAPWVGAYSDVARWLHSVSGGSSGSRLVGRRRREDVAATRMLGAGWRHFKWRDAVYRAVTGGGPLYKEVIGDTWHPDDEPFIQDMSAMLRKELRTSDVLMVPLGVGNHVDHLIVRRAGESLGRSQLLYYADLPYAAKRREEVADRTKEMSRFSYSLSASQIQTWIDAIYCYRTQIAMLEHGASSLSDMIYRQIATHQLEVFGLPDSELPHADVWSKR